MLASAKTTRDPGTESGACRLVRIPLSVRALRGALKANLISMLGVLAWLYPVAPVI